MEELENLPSDADINEWLEKNPNFNPAKIAEMSARMEKIDFSTDMVGAEELLKEIETMSGPKNAGKSTIDSLFKDMDEQLEKIDKLSADMEEKVAETLDKKNSEL